MKLGRESLILVVVPLLLMGAAFGLLLRGYGEGQLPRFRAPPVVTTPGTRAPADAVSGDLVDLSERRVAPVSSGLESAAGGAPSHAAEPAIPRNDGNDQTTNAPPRVDSTPRFRSPFQGRVVDSEGRPMAGTKITATKRRNLFGNQSSFDLVRREPGPNALSNALGEFTLQREVGHVYEITIEAPGYARRVVQLWSYSLGEIALARSSTLSGTVRASDGTPVPGAHLTVVLEGAPIEQVSSADGAFVFSNLGLGLAGVHVHHPSFEPTRVLIKMSAGLDVRRDIVLAQGIRFTGRVVLEGSGAPAPGVFVQAFDRYDHLPAGAAETDGSGTFVFDSFRAGRIYVLTARSQLFGASTLVVTVPMNGVVPERVMVLRPTWALEGFVRDALGTPVSETNITLTTSPGMGVTNAVLSAVTDGAGRFVVPELDPQVVYRVMAYHPGFALAVRYNVNRSDFGDAPLQVTLVASGEIRGTIFDSGGSPVPYVLVRARRLLATSAAENVAGGSTASELHTYTMEDGTFSITNLPGGPVEITTFRNGYDTARTVVSLHDGEVRTGVDLVVIPLGQ